MMRRLRLNDRNSLQDETNANVSLVTLREKMKESNNTPHLNSLEKSLIREGDCDARCVMDVEMCSGVLSYLAVGNFQNFSTYIDIALSMLVDATSLGPDPTSQAYLGWSYGYGSGGGMGDWGACHNYFGEHVRHALREVERKVAVDINGTFSNVTNSSLLIQDDDYNILPTTRFCTIGGLGPRGIPYNPDGYQWQPSISGICVPSACTSDALYFLFRDDNFRQHLLREAGTGRKSNPDTTYLSNSIIVPKSFQYISSLSSSIATGIGFQMGIQCAGETGLPELDYLYLGEYYRDMGFKFTLALIFVLITAAILGTLFSLEMRKRDAVQCCKENKKSDTCTESIREGSKETTPLVVNNTREPFPNNIFTSHSFLREKETDETTDAQFAKNVDNFDGGHPYSPSETKINTSKTHIYGSVINDGGACTETPSMILAYSEYPHNFVKSSNPAFTEHAIWKILPWIKNTLSVFDVAQSFFEITRISKDELCNDIAHQEQLKREGESTLDGSSSSTSIPLIFLASGQQEKTMEVHADSDIDVEAISISSSSCLNGMRALSMIWIMLAHTLAVESSVGYQNPWAVIPPSGIMSSTPGMFFPSARYAVDTFFFVSGYLVMSGLLKRLDPVLRSGGGTQNAGREPFVVEVWLQNNVINRQHRVLGKYAHRLHKIDEEHSRDLLRGYTIPVIEWWCPFILHRVLRILPTYAFILLLWWKIAVTLSDGPFWSRWATFVSQCDSKAWTNMLFINNLVPQQQFLGETSECMYHAWYLGVDMQLCAFLTPILLSFYLWREGNIVVRKKAILLEILLIGIIAGASFFNTFRLDWSGHMADGAQTLNFDRDFYINPFYRATPYIFGFVTAQAWHEKSRIKPDLGLRKWASVTLSLLSILLLLFVVYFGSSAYSMRPCLIWQSVHSDQCGSGWTKLSLAAYNSLIRPIWSLALLILSLLSFNGQLCALGASSILHWPGWGPVSKLSLSLYLLHPIVIQVWFLSSKNKFIYSHIDFLFRFAGIFTLTFLFAIVVGILVEWPFSKLSRRFESWLWRRLNPTTVNE